MTVKYECKLKLMLLNLFNLIIFTCAARRTLAGDVRRLSTRYTYSISTFVGVPKWVVS